MSRKHPVSVYSFSVRQATISIPDKRQDHPTAFFSEHRREIRVPVRVFRLCGSARGSVACTHMFLNHRQPKSSGSRLSIPYILFLYSEFRIPNYDFLRKSPGSLASSSCRCTLCIYRTHQWSGPRTSAVSFGFQKSHTMGSPPRNLMVTLLFS